MAKEKKRIKQMMNNLKALGIIILVCLAILVGSVARLFKRKAK